MHGIGGLVCKIAYPDGSRQEEMLTSLGGYDYTKQIDLKIDVLTDRSVRIDDGYWGAWFLVPSNNTYRLLAPLPKKQGTTDSDLSVND